MARRYLLLADIDLGSESSDALRLAVTLPSATVGVPYVGALAASGGVLPYVYDDTPAGTVPPGLSIDDTTGAVTGTPNTVGYYEFTAAVTDGAAATASQVVSIRVTSGIAFSGAFALGEVGIAYSSGLSAAGGTGPYTWTLPSGSLPGGLGPIDSSTGIVAGTPTTPGTFNFTVRATDSLGNPQDFPTSITIAAALDISTSNYPDGFIGVFYNAGPTVIGGVAPISYSISSGAIPAGTNFSPSTGFVTGVPTTAATYTFDITGTDSLGGADTFSASVDITAGGGGGGSGTVTDFTAGNLSPLFNTSVGTSTTTPALAFAQIAQAINLVFAGPASGGSADPTFRALVTNDLPSTAVTPATYGDSTHVAQVTFDAKGRATAAANVAISPTGIGAAKISQTDVYTAAGSTTWNKPAGAKIIQVIALGAGGGGAGGCRRGAAGTTNGASGGGGGSYASIIFDAALAGSSETVIVGAGGAGGAAQVGGTNSNGNIGSPGGDSSFGTIVKAYGGGAGGNGGATSGGGGGGGGSSQAGQSGTSAIFGAGGEAGGSAGTNGSVVPTSAVAFGGGGGAANASGAAGVRGGNSVYGGAGGGGGGSVQSGGVTSTGGQGGLSLGSPTNVAGGTSPGGNGAPGTNPGLYAGGNGGGGGGSGSTGSGGNGGNGGKGAGGGGGAPTLTGTQAGAGGNGGDGLVVVITWF